MKILITLFNLPISLPCGSCKYVEWLAMSLVKKWHLPVVLSNLSDSWVVTKLEKLWVIIVQIETERLNSWANTFSEENKYILSDMISAYLDKIAELDKHYWFDCIHFQHLIPSNLLAIHCKYILGIPSICTFQWTENYETEQKFNTIFELNGFEKILCLSTFLSDQIPHTKNKIVISPGVPGYFYPRLPSIGNDKKQLIIIARLIKEKGIFESINVFVELLRLRGSRFAVLNIVWDWYLKDEIIERYSDYIDSKQIILHGWLDHNSVADLMRNMDLFMFWSIWDEPFGITLIENMISWVPIVATNVWVVKDILPFWYRYITNDRKEYLLFCIELLDNDQTDLKFTLLKHSEKYQWSMVSDLIIKEYSNLCK